MKNSTQTKTPPSFKSSSSLAGTVDGEDFSGEDVDDDFKLKVNANLEDGAPNDHSSKFQIGVEIKKTGTMLRLSGPHTGCISNTLFVIISG